MVLRTDYGRDGLSDEVVRVTRLGRLQAKAAVDHVRMMRLRVSRSCAGWTGHLLQPPRFSHGDVFAGVQHVSVGMSTGVMDNVRCAKRAHQDLPKPRQQTWNDLAQAGKLRTPPSP